MRSVILFLAVLTARCAQPDKRKKGDTPVVMEKPPLSQPVLSAILFTVMPPS